MLLRDITRQEGQILAVRDIVTAVSPDILLLTDFDHDHDGLALAAFAALMSEAGLPLVHTFASAPNSGVPTGLDLDRNGRMGEARDAQGYGRFSGDGGMAIFSRWPIDGTAVRDLSALLWRDLPGATLPESEGKPYYDDAVLDVLRLSTTGHWIVPVVTEAGPLSLLAYSATPPVFDGPEDRNGLRNRDELRLWEQVLDGDHGPVPPGAVVIGNTNLDPVEGEGDAPAMAAFLARPDVIDPAPSGAGGVANPSKGHSGDPALDTADWLEEGPGNLRVSYVLPTTGWRVTGAGVFWPGPDDPQAALLGEDGLLAGPHRLVWVDVTR